MTDPANPVPCRRIGDHGVIGNLETAALVARDGAIDYLCWPKLDSPTIFAALLDPEKGGEFTIATDIDAPEPAQLYVPDTNVLQTRWLGEDASAEMIDFMPHPGAAGPGHTRCLIRRITVTRGSVRFDLACAPRFDYARAVPDTRQDGDAVIFSAADVAIRMSASLPLTAGEGIVEAQFVLGAGESAWFALSPEGAAPLDEALVGRLERETIGCWHHWSGRSTYKGRWREAMSRSALALKLLTSHEHGSIAAAVTFGLPEATGAGRNWDYRATWIRDASFTIYAFLRLGHIEEAQHFRAWLDRCQPSGEAPLRVMYALDGSPAADETVLDHLAGYACSRPVRIGNGAHDQQQLDIYGELMDGIYLINKYGQAISHESWTDVCRMIEHVCEIWDSEDAGIWELRGELRHLTHSRLMCWVALDRAIRLAQKRSLSGPIAHWQEQREAIARDVWDNFRHPEHGYFVQERGGTHLDAALLMMPLVRFVSATDPVWLRTLDAIGEQLADDGMVYRYRNNDGLEGGEGAFLACTFWYVECLARAGRLKEAEMRMAEAMGFANHLGLFSEEVDRRGNPLGNFPQGLTHLAFISAAFFLDRRLDNPSGGQWQP